MGYSAEVVQRARARLAQAKEDRESENRQHLAEAYAIVPRIREIDMLLRRTMAQAAAVAAAVRTVFIPYPSPDRRPSPWQPGPHRFFPVGYSCPVPPQFRPGPALPPGEMPWQTGAEPRALK